MKRLAGVVASVVFGLGLCAPPSWADDGAVSAPPAIRVGDVPDTHPAVLYDDGRVLWWCAEDLDVEYTVCERAVVYPAGTFGFTP